MGAANSLREMILLLLYSALVRPHLEHCPVLGSPLQEEHGHAEKDHKDAKGTGASLL